MKKRITALSTAAVIFFSALSPAITDITANAVSYDMVLQDVYSSENEDMIAVDLKMVQNSGFISGTVDVDWDKNALTLESVYFGTSFNVVFSGNTGDTVEYAVAENNNDMQPTTDVAQYYTDASISDVSGTELINSTYITKDNDSVTIPDGGITDGCYRVALGDYLAEEDNSRTGYATTLWFKKTDSFDSTKNYTISLSNADFVNYDVEQLEVQTLGCSVYAMDDDKLGVFGETVNCYAGDEVRVPVDITGNPGYIAGNFDVSWDKDTLTLTDIAFNEEIAPDCGSPDIPEGGITSGKYKVTIGKLLAEENCTGTGTAFTLVFKTSKNASGATNIGFSNADVVNYDVEQVECKFTPATVIINESGYFYDEDTDTLTIKGTVDGYGLNYYRNKLSLKKVYAEPGTKITGSLSYAFSGSTAEEIDLANADTSEVTSMQSLFYDCKNLKKLNITGLDTSNVTNMSYMFTRANVEEVDLSSFDTSKVTNMSYMFYDNPYIKKIDISSFDLSNVEDIRGMFYADKNLETLVIGDHIVGKAADLNSMFYQCESLKELDLSGFRTPAATDMRSMFGYCESLESINLSGFDTSNTKRMSYLFCNCPKLTSLDLSSFDMSCVTDGDNMFKDTAALDPYKCSLDSFRTVIGSESVTTFTAELGDAADHAVLTYGENETSIADLQSLKQPDGKYQFTYTSSANADEAISLSVFDKNDRQLIALDTNGKLQNHSRLYVSRSENLYTKYSAKEATCDSEGNTEYYIGSDGKYYVLNGDTYTETEENSWVIEATGHSYGTPIWSWSNNGNGYTATMKSVCSKCGNVETHNATVTSITADGVITYTATATVDDVDYTSVQEVNVSYPFAVVDGTITKGEKEFYSYGDAVTVQAEESKDGKYFSGWYVGDTRITTKQSYTFYVKSNMTVTAKYEGEAVQEEQADVSVMITRTNIANSKQKVVFSLNWALPEGCTLKEAGIVRRYDSSENLTLANVDGSDIKKNASTLRTRNGNCNFNLTVSATTKLRSINAAAYVTYIYKNGDVQTVYSTVKTSEYNN